MLFNCTHGAEDPARATLPFLAANVAAIGGQQAVVLCTIDAVWLGTTGGTDEVVGAAAVVEEVVNGAKTVAFA